LAVERGSGGRFAAAPFALERAAYPGGFAIEVFATDARGVRYGGTGRLDWRQLPLVE
jgi:hypothetical protein